MKRLQREDRENRGSVNQIYKSQKEYCLECGMHKKDMDELGKKRILNEELMKERQKNREERGRRTEKKV